MIDFLLARRLEETHPSAAASVREGLEETLTITALGLSDSLRRSLSSTNAAESLISRTRHVKRNVKRWRGGQMVLRWVAAGVLEAVKGLSSVEGPSGNAEARRGPAGSRSATRFRRERGARRVVVN
jgi:putative transposase